jgi:hypothetical protein
MDTTGSSTEALAQRLLDDEAVIAEARGRQMTILRELDLRQTALRDGHRSLIEWVTGRLDVAPETARELVGTARRLAELPEIDHSVATGAIGFDRAVAVSRFAGRDDSVDILSETAGFDIAGIRHLVARRRRMTRLDEQIAFESRYVTVQPNLDESGWRLHGQLPGFAGRVVVDALEARADVFPYGPDAAPSRTTRNADALWSIALDSTQGSDGVSVESAPPTVTVFVDATGAAPTNGEAGVHDDAGLQVGRNTIEAILCDGIIEVTARSQDGTPLAMGRRSRIVPPRLRRFVVHRDGAACTIAGCVSRYRLQVHHIRPWSEGGGTDPDNLTTVCWFHHHVVIHGRGFTIDPDSPPQRRRLLRPRSHAPPRRTSRRAA